MANLKQKIVKGAFWAMLEKIGIRGMSFLVTLVLARLLTPGDYGTVALLTIFISIASVIADSGFGQALIQKKDATDLDFNSVFYLSLAWTTCIYGVLFFCAPLIAKFYSDIHLVPIVRVLGLTILFHSVSSVQGAELSRRMLFNLSFRVSLIVSITQGVVGVSLAFTGFGAWAIVWSQIIAGAVNVIALWIVIAWRPKLMFSWKAVGGLFRFGWKLTASELINTTYNNLYGLFIGRLYSKEDLAFVQKGQSVPYLGMETINGTLGRVAFPALSQIQGDLEKLRESMRRIIQCSTFFVFPLMTGCAICASNLVLVMFGEAWLPAVPYLQLACFSFALWPIHTVNLQALSAQGRSDIYLKLEIVKKLLGITALAASYRHGVMMMMLVVTFFNSPLGIFVNIWPNRRLLGYTVQMLLRDIWPTACVCGIMSAVICGMDRLFALFIGERMTIQKAVVSLSLDVIGGGLTYLVMSWVFRVRAAGEVLMILKPFLGKRTPRFESVFRRFNA